MAKQNKYTRKKTKNKTQKNTKNRTRRRNGCNIMSVLSSLTTFLYGKPQSKSKSKSKSPTPTRQYTFPYHVVLITTHGEDTCRPESSYKNISLPDSFRGGHIIRTGPLGNYNYCYNDFVKKIKNAIKLVVDQNKHMDESNISPELFRTAVRESDKNEDRATYFDKPFTEYPIYEINQNLPEREYSIFNYELDADKDNFDFSIMLLSENTIDLMKKVTGRSKIERVTKYKKTKKKRMATFTLSQILDVLHKRDPTKKVIVIDYGCSGDGKLTERSTRWLSRTFRSNKRTTKKIPKMTVVD